MPFLARMHLPAATVAVGVLFLTLTASAEAQVPVPPQTLYGSITDSGGDVPAGVAIQAIVNNNVCGEDETVYTGDGGARVTVYSIDVLSDRQVPGCGKPGDAVRLRIGDRLGEAAVQWEAGPVRFNVVFGDATPAPIPTFTPTITPTPLTALLTRTPPTEATPPAGGTTTAAAETTTPAATSTGDDPTAVSTRPGGVTSTTPAAGDAAGSSGDGGGFPVWALLMLVIGGVAAVGGGIGYAMSRTGRTAEPTAPHDPVN